MGIFFALKPVSDDPLRMSTERKFKTAQTFKTEMAKLGAEIANSVKYGQLSPDSNITTVLFPCESPEM